MTNITPYFNVVFSAPHAHIVNLSPYAGVAIPDVPMIFTLQDMRSLLDAIQNPASEHESQAEHRARGELFHHVQRSLSND